MRKKEDSLLLCEERDYRLRRGIVNGTSGASKKKKDKPLPVYSLMVRREIHKYTTMFSKQCFSLVRIIKKH
jgi:hypothetical protein